MRVSEVCVRFITACSLLGSVVVDAQPPLLLRSGEKQQSEYNTYCGSQDKQNMETAASVTDANKRINSCKCGFLQTSHHVENTQSISGAIVPCVGGFAGSYPCSNVDLMSFMNVAAVELDSNTGLNDIWGWTDPVTSREYALVGTKTGTSFIDITDPINPIHLGKLPSHNGGSSTWRDIKTYSDNAYIVSEDNQHGMQVFDLTQLRGLETDPNIPLFFSETAHYNSFGNCHNIAINEDSGYAYAVGTNTCAGGLHMIDITSPQTPVFAGCFGADGYTHDVQCVNYQGSDATYVGREICFASNTDRVTIVDVTVKNTPVLISSLTYPNSQQTYTHQGWLTPDHNYFIFGDETDEQINSIPTTTLVVNVVDLDNPVLAGFYTALTAAIDHNQYIKNNLVYQANYRAGLRILDIVDISTASFQEIGYFDIYPANDNASFNGAWSNYPYFASGSIVVSGIEQGLFVLQPSPPAPITPGPTPTPTSTPNPTPVPTQACANVGDRCRVTPCCAGLECRNGRRCVAPPTPAPTLSPGSSPAPTPQCGGRNSPCSENSDCCSNRCRNNGRCRG